MYYNQFQMEQRCIKYFFMTIVRVDGSILEIIHEWKEYVMKPTKYMAYR